MEHGVGASGLNDTARIHDRNAVSHFRNHAKIMGDQHQRRAGFIDQLIHQIKNLRLNRHVEGCRRLIGYQQVRLTRNRHGNHHTLALPAGKLVRIKIEIEAGCRQADAIKQPARFTLRIRPAFAKVQAASFGNLRANGLDQIERRHRLLKDHRHAPSAHPAQFGFRHGGKVLPIEAQCTAHTHPVGQQPHGGKGGDRLAAAGFAHYAKAFAAIERQRDIGHDICNLEADWQFDGHIVHFEQWFCHLCLLTRGSSTSRNPSPSMLRPSTASVMARPGKMASHGAS